MSEQTKIREPIALIGIGCRLPGGIVDAASYWSFIRGHGDGVAPVPADRYDLERYYDPDPDAPGKVYVDHAGFLDQDVRQFDAAPFGISPREACALDPQQRLLLEVGFEAIEDAGLSLPSLSGSRTGVFVGGFTLDAMVLALSSSNRPLISQHTSTGMTMTVLSNRLSYTWDLRGPSLTVDTACSSSLVATHLACRAIADGECDLALVGGVNVMLSPAFSIVMCKGHFLAPDGRSKAFDAAADGYGRGEGAAMVVLKPLSRALADHDRIHAVVRATAVNQDGRTDGMPMPSGAAQEEIIRRAVAEAGIDAGAVGYVEAHGTGTRVGDPIEAGALGRVYGQHPARRNACRIGSVKTNIGHLEAAAGVAGLIKAALTVERREIAPQRALATPNPEIDFAGLGLTVAVAAEAWPETSGEALAAVNSFGYGGTNAHAIVGEPPVVVTALRSPSPIGRPHVFPLSAYGGPALAERARQLAPLVAAAAPEQLHDIGYTLARRRSHLPHRAVVIGADAGGLAAALERLGRGEATPDVTVGEAIPGGSDGAVFVLTGMGPQWWAMGRSLLTAEPVFRDAAVECDRRFSALAGWSILAELSAEEGASRMRENAIAQPANFVLQVALGALLRERGVRPAAIIGHSVGEVAAAYLAGGLSLDDAVRVAFHRSRLQQRVAGKGTMLAVGLGEGDAARLLDPAEDVCVAAINAPDAVTLSGSALALARIAVELERRGVFQRPVSVEVAYHSAHMEPLRGELVESLASIAPSAPTTPLYSTVTGEPVAGATHDADYFWRNARQPVQLARALARAVADGHRHFLEVGPHPVLAASIRAALTTAGVRGSTSFTLKRGEPDARSFARAIGELHVRGTAIDWSATFPGGRSVDLPTYPWQRETHWTESDASRDERLGRTGAHPMLRDDQRQPNAAWTTELAGPRFAFLDDHRVDGSVVFPGAGFVEAMLAADRALHGDGTGLLEEIAFRQALRLGDEARPSLAVSLAPDGGVVSVHSRVGESPWTLHASARLAPTHRYETPPVMSPLPPVGARAVDTSALYDRLTRAGLSYGPAFRGLSALCTLDGEVWATIESPVVEDARYLVHPTVLDAAFQALLAAAPATDDDGPILPVAISRLRLLARPGLRVRCHGRLRVTGERRILGDLRLLDDEGHTLVELVGLECQRLPRPAASRAEQAWLYETRWPAITEPPKLSQRPYVLVGGEPDFAGAVAAALNQQGSAAYCVPDRAALSVRLALTPRAAVVLLPDRRRDDAAGLERSTELVALINALPPTLGVERLIIVTLGAQAAQAGDVVDPAEAALWGVGRVVITERPDLACTLLDADPLPLAPSPTTLAQAIGCERGEEEVAVRGSTRYASRICRIAGDRPPSRPAREIRNSRSSPVELVIERPGLLDTLAFRPSERRAPRDGEVEVEVHAVGLNFKDVMKAMGMLSRVATDGSYLGADLGMEASGRVVRVGAGVSRVAPGDDVFVYCGGAMRSFLTTAERFVGRRVDGHDHLQAATYFVLVTAWHALVDVARLEAGERVLIHSAAGGVGLAAVRIARSRGAEVFATAGTEEKRAYLRGLGIRHVMSSRSLDFADEVLRATDGRGVDVVLNSLAGPSLERSLAVLAPCGRFVELGKQDIVENRPLGMLPFNRSLTFAAIDLDRMANDRPTYYQPLARTVTAALASGALETLPLRVFPAREVADAFRALAGGGHIGKIVVDLRDCEIEVAPSLAPRPLARADRSYLITGGTRGFGLATARFLVERGARHVILASRGGAVAASDQPIVDEMIARGAGVQIVALDVSDADAVAARVHAIGVEGPPLAGVFHAAMVLDDAPLHEQTPERFARVMAPKALGALHLHAATRELPLDHFVLFSSVSALVGNPGQASYAAANALLDGLAHHRAALGLPGLSINWGLIGEVGAAARDGAVTQHLGGMGLAPLPPARALALLATLLGEGRAQVGLVDIDWNQWIRATPGASWNRLEGLRKNERGQPGDEALSRLRAAVAGAAPAEWSARLRERLAEAAAKVLKLPVERLDPERSFKDYGLDSLMAVELRVEIEQSLGVELSAIELLAGAGAAQLATRLAKRIAAPEIAPAPVAARAPARSTPEELRRQLLARICVQPPYFSLEDLRLDGDRIIAEVVPDASSPREHALVGSAEAARHLAILGSCAAAIANPDPARTYYPVHRARVLARGADVAALEVRAHRRFRLSARCLHFDAAQSTATAETELRTLDGILVLGFAVDYHVIPEVSFRTLFADRERPTDGDGNLTNPYSVHRALAHDPFDGHRIVAVLDEVRAADCAGHFRGYPAFPVSIMARHAFDLVAEGCRQRSGWRDVRCAVVGGAAETTRFVWAGERVTFEARPLSGERWRCDVSTSEGLAARFTMEIAARPG